MSNPRQAEQSLRPRDRHSAGLRAGRDQIQRGKPEKAMRLLERLTQLPNANPRRICKIASLVADSENRQGRFEAAAAYYRMAANYYADGDPRDWFRPALGEVRALVKAVRADEAVQRAEAIWDRALALHEEQQTRETLTGKQLRARGPVRVERRPIRASVIGHRLGNLFLAEGEPEVAKEFFLRAVEINPHGACRARQGLAKITYREGNFTEAEKWANEALLVGKGQAKTIGIWEILITARIRQGKTPILREHLAGVGSIRNPLVQERIVFEVIKCLRAHAISPDEVLQKSWLRRIHRSETLVSLEMNRLRLADAKRQDDFKEITASAEAVILHPLLPPNLIRGAAKSYTMAWLKRGGNPARMEEWIESCRASVGEHKFPALLHSVARAAREAGNSALAAKWLKAIVEETPPSRQQWGISCALLAEIELERGNRNAACALLLRYGSQVRIPAQFRTKALLSAMNALDDSAPPNVARDVEEQFIEVIDGVSEPEALLLIARQLSFERRRFPKLFEQTVNRVEAAFLEPIKNAEDPRVVLTYLIQLTRKRYFDFYQHQKVVDQFLAMSEERLLWLWTPRNEYWEYLGIVYQSFLRTGDTHQAERLVQKYVEDAATPPTGRATLRVLWAQEQLRLGKKQVALEAMRQVVEEIPTHRVGAIAYYWLAVDSLIKGDTNSALRKADLIRRCFASRPSLLTEWELDAKACLIQVQLGRMERQKIPAKYNTDFIASMTTSLENDQHQLAKL